MDESGEKLIDEQKVRASVARQGGPSNVRQDAVVPKHPGLRLHLRCRKGLESIVADEVREDERGLWVKGRILTDVARGREAAALVGAGAIDGLSIGYRTVKSAKTDKGQRLLSELELWEVSLVTFPMLPDARVGAKGDTPEALVMREMAEAFVAARRILTPGI